jgi:hypothetical protein
MLISAAWCVQVCNVAACYCTEFIYCNVKENVRRCSWSFASQFGGSLVNKQCDVRSHKLSQHNVLRIVCQLRFYFQDWWQLFLETFLITSLLRLLRTYFRSSELSCSDKIRPSFRAYLATVVMCNKSTARELKDVVTRTAVTFMREFPFPCRRSKPQISVRTISFCFPSVRSGKSDKNPQNKPRLLLPSSWDSFARTGCPG